ncbi:MAG: hypothetical protein EON90_10640 [Brevundimonas sp.]|nr:MAG: hypothetical protein EON90_10640 [Brevundimonas sp.]
MSRAPRAASPSQPFEALRKALTDLPATRAGFEGLIGALLSRATGDRIRLLSSGEQGGADGVTDPAPGTPRRAVQAKRYKSDTHLAIAGLRVEMDRAVRSFSALETWVLATTKVLRGTEAEQLRRHGQLIGIGVLVLDWDSPGGNLPRLAVLAAAYPDATATFLSRRRRSVWAEIEALQADPDFGSAHERLQRELSTADLGFGGVQLATTRRLQRVFEDPAAAHAIAGASPRFLSSAPPVARSAVASALEAWGPESGETAVLLGHEGVGKTWSALDALKTRTEASPLAAPIVISSHTARRTEHAVAAVIDGLTEAAIDQGVRLDNSSVFWRRRLALWAEAQETADPPRLLVLIDGLDEAPDLDWGLWIAPLLDTRWKGLFEVLITCRDQVWSHAIAGALTEVGRYRVVPIGLFTEPERDAYLASRGIAVGDLSPETAQAVRHPRTAFHLSRLAASLPDVRRITREQLLLADFQNRDAVTGRLPLTPDAFEALVRGLAVAARDAALSQNRLSLSAGDIGRRAYDVGGVGDRDLPRVLTDLQSGTWCRRDPDDPTRITFEDAMLPYAVGMALAHQLRRTGGDADAEIAAFLEPWGADDLTERVLRMTATALIIDPSVADDLVAVVLKRWRDRPFRTTAAEDFWRRLHVFRPSFFLDLCLREGGEMAEWLSEWGIAHLWRDYPQHRDLVDRTLFNWLVRNPLPAEYGHPADPVPSAFNYARRRQMRSVKALNKIVEPDWGCIIGLEPPEHRDACVIALRVLAYLPRTPFVPSLAGWALAASLARRLRHQDLVAALLRFNPFDADEAEAAVGTAAEALSSPDDRRSRRAASYLLAATGRPDHADRIEALALRPAAAVEFRPFEVNDGVIAPGPDRPGRLASILHGLADQAANPDLKLSGTLQRAVETAVRRLDLEDVTYGLGAARPDLLAAMRWAPALLARQLRPMLVGSARKARDFQQVSDNLGLFTTDDLKSLRRTSAVSSDNPATSRQLAVQIAGRSFARQARFLLSTTNEAWPENFARLLDRLRPAQIRTLLCSIQFDRPWPEIWRPVTLAIGALEALGARMDDPGLDWTRAFTISELYGLKQVLRLAGALKAPRAAEALVARDWRALPDLDQGARFLGSEVHRWLDESVLETRLEFLEPDIWFDLYLDRPALRPRLGELWRAWLERKLAHTGSRSFGGDHWSYPREQEAYELFCVDNLDWAQRLLEETWEDEARRRNLTWDDGDGCGWRLAKALAPHAPDRVARLWSDSIAELSGIRSSRVDRWPAELPEGEVFDALRLTMIRRAVRDNDLFGAVQALERGGHAAWIERQVAIDLAGPRPAVRARGLTMAGFMAAPSTDGPAARALAEPPGRGWLSEVQAVAQGWRDRGRWMHHWVGDMLSQADEPHAWAANQLFKSIADERYVVWWAKPPLVREHRDWRSQWINFDGSERRAQQRRARDDTRKTFLHTPVAEGVLPPMNVESLD